MQGIWMRFALTDVGLNVRDVRGMAGSNIVILRPHLVTITRNKLTIIHLCKPQKKISRRMHQPKQRTPMKQKPLPK